MQMAKHITSLFNTSSIVGTDQHMLGAARRRSKVKGEVAFSYRIVDALVVPLADRSRTNVVQMWASY